MGDGDEYTIAELGRDIRKLETLMDQRLGRIEASIARRVSHDEFRARLETVDERVAGGRERATAAYRLAMWAVGLVATLVVGATVSLIVAVSRGA